MGITKHYLYFFGVTQVWYACSLFFPINCYLHILLSVLCAIIVTMFGQHYLITELNQSYIMSLIAGIYIYLFIATIFNYFINRFRLKDFLQRKELEDMQAHLVHSEKLASLGLLSAGVAHEINNPIYAVGMEVSNIEDYYQDMHTGKVAQEAFVERLMKRSLPLINQGLDRMGKIVLALKQFSRKDREGMNTDVNINEELDQTLLLLNTKIKDQVEVKREYTARQLIECNAGEINQVFLNMIDNALDAMKEKQDEEKRRITREQGESQFPAQPVLSTLTVGTQDSGHAVVVMIRDTGSGMSPEVIPRIFEPFFTTKKTKASGLGLAISYGIVQSHGGSIDVQSEVGKGSTFIITIPDQKYIKEG